MDIDTNLMLTIAAAILLASLVKHVAQTALNELGHAMRSARNADNHAPMSASSSNPHNGA